MTPTASLQALYETVRGVIPPFEWSLFAPDIEAILRLKKERNAIILAHNYQTPEIYYGVADGVGDSLALARLAQGADADVIVLCGVHFMAETAKILNPSRRVLIPDLKAGCSLAASITAADVVALRAQYPGVPVVGYVNTSAAVKAQCDACCTSSNAVCVVESFGSDRVILLPDQYLSQNTQSQTKVEIISWAGACEVHELFSAKDVEEVRKAYDQVQVLAHPECPKEVVDGADFCGSTSAMGQYIETHKPRRVALLTECSMGSNIAAQHPEVEFVKPCHLCPHMKTITLPKIRACLQTLSPEVHISDNVAEGARRALERMLAVTTP